MKARIYVIDFEIPARVKKWCLRIGIPVGLLLGGGAVAYAAGLVTWSSGQTLQASDLNGNFSYLQGEISGLMTSVAALQAAQGFTTSTACSYNANGEYTGCTCSPGQTAISGGAYLAGTAGWIQGSQQNVNNPAEWDIGCANAAGTRVTCLAAFAICAK